MSTDPRTSNSKLKRQPNPTRGNQTTTQGVLAALGLSSSISKHRCEDCERDFADVHGLSRHQSSHLHTRIRCTMCRIPLPTNGKHRCPQQASGFPCDLCGARHTNQALLDSHYLDIHSRKFPCDLCPAIFDRRAEHKEHSATSHPKFPCQSCSLGFSNEAGLAAHAVVHVPEFYPPQPLSDKNGIAQSNVSLATLNHSGDSEELMFIDLHELNNPALTEVAIARSYAQVVKGGRRTPTTISELPCESDRLILTDQADFDAHRTVHDAQYSCILCPLFFSEQSTFATHCTSAHAPESLCDKCGIPFPTEVTLDAHYSSPHQSILLCFSCTKSLATAPELDLWESLLPDLIPRCEKCSIEFQNTNDFNVHAKVCTRGVAPIEKYVPQFKYIPQFSKPMLAEPTGQVRCEGCNKDFAKQSSLDAHMRASARHRCHECENHYVDYEDLQKHKAEAHPSFPCDSCPKSFVSQATLGKHTANKHPARFQCRECDKVFTVLTALEEHREEVHPTFNCDICNTLFASRSLLDIHTAAAHLLKLPCDSCDNEFVDQGTLLRHRTEEHRTIRCTKCPMLCTSQNMLDQHVSNVHDPMPSPPSTVKETPYFTCDRCNENFTSLAALGVHTSTMHASRYRCESCDVGFVSTSALTQHLHTLSHIARFRCAICNRCYLNAASLTHHTLTMHRPEFYCEKCELGFTDRISLNEHLLSPEHQLTFYCDECDRAFASYDLLENHHDSFHTVELFACEHCETKMEDQRAMELHKMTCGRAPSLACDECSEHFKRKDELTLHAAMHIMSRLGRQRLA